MTIALGACEREPERVPLERVKSVVVAPSEVSMGPAGEAQLQAQANDAEGRPVGGVPIAFKVDVADVCRVTPSGLVEAVGKVGACSVNVTAASHSFDVPVQVVPGAAAQLEVTSGTGQSGVVRNTLRDPVVVRALDARGNPVPGATVAFGIAAGGGVVAPERATTDEDGHAAAVWSLGQLAGTQKLTVTIPNTHVLATASASAAPGELATLTLIDRLPDASPVGTTLSPIRFLARDEFGNPVPGVEVDALASGASVVTPATGTTDSLGIATFDWQIAKAPGAVSLRARAEEQAVDVDVNALVGAPASVVIVRGDGGQARVRKASRVAPVVRVLDAFGNPVPGVPVTFKADGGGRVEVPAVTTSPAGEARPGKWFMGDAPGTSTLTAAVDGTPGVVLHVVTKP
ncbi:MAG: Ig-like domain-containing protein [Polyangiales bacterium]|nr:Ig-like domain-containing protein [Myxococcales bacterium]